MGQRSRGGSREIRRHECLRRRRPAVCTECGGGTAPWRRPDGHPWKRAGLRARCLGNGRRLDGLPQWQIEALRRLEIPEDMQRKYGFKPIGAADGPIKTMIFGITSAKLYNFDLGKRTDIGPSRDRFARLKDEYEKSGPARSNLRYGYVRQPVDWSAFA
jgi:hypothetical protein